MKFGVYGIYGISYLLYVNHFANKSVIYMKFLNFIVIEDFFYYNVINILPPPLEKVQMGECL